MSSRSSKSVLILAALLMSHSPLAIADNDELPASEAIRPTLYATGFETAEGPALNEAGDLFVANYRGNGKIGRIKADGSAAVWCELAKLSPVEGRNPQARGLKIDGEQRLIVADAGGGRLLRISENGARVEVLSDRWEGKRFQAVNDVALDPAGHIYFTDPGGSTADNPVGSVYQYNINTKRVEQLDSELAHPTGVAVTADSRQLFVAEGQRFRVLMYDLHDGKATNRRLLIRFPQENVGPFKGGEFRPAGMVFDQQARLYVAMGRGGVINVVASTTGELLRQYDAGGEQATNCHFHNDYLYTTIAAKEAVFRLKLGVKGLLYNRAQ